MSSRSVKKTYSKHTNNAARERSRVQSLRAAFLDLQRSLPSVPPDTKLSKLDVLVLATAYIYHLTQTLDGQSDDQTSTWATIHQPTSGNTDTTEDPQFLIEPMSGISYSCEKSSTLSYGNTDPEIARQHHRPGEHDFYSNLICGLSVSSSPHNAANLTPHRCGSDNGHMYPNARVKSWKFPSQKREIRPRLLTNQNGAVGILHPVKKWPMRCRLYDKILGHEPVLF